MLHIGSRPLTIGIGSHVTYRVSTIGNLMLHIGSRPLVTSCYYRVPTAGNLMLHIGSRPLVTSCCI